MLSVIHPRSSQNVKCKKKYSFYMISTIIMEVAPSQHFKFRYEHIVLAVCVGMDGWLQMLAPSPVWCVPLPVRLRKVNHQSVNCTLIGWQSSLCWWGPSGILDSQTISLLTTIGAVMVVIKCELHQSDWLFQYIPPSSSFRATPFPFCLLGPCDVLSYRKSKEYKNFIAYLYEKTFVNEICC